MGPIFYLTVSVFIILSFGFVTLFCFGKRGQSLDKKPTILVRWKGDSVEHKLSDNHLREWAIFKLFDEQFFNQHKLPLGQISYRNLTQSVDSLVITKLIEELIFEVQSGKTQFSNFIVLRDKTFNKKLGSGLLTVKFKDYPFVVKLFIENPYSFVNPFKKGFERYLSFLVGGGINLHLGGFTRIKNLIHVNQRISESPEWSQTVETPHKWFWMPDNSPELEITGFNIGSEVSRVITIPGTYCIVTDFIESELSFKIESITQYFKMSASEKEALRKQADITLPLCNYLDYSIDPNVDNFIIERGTKKIVIIDTEHYPSLAGYTTKPKSINSYLSCFCFLMTNSIRNIFFQPHNKRGIPFDMQYK